MDVDAPDTDVCVVGVWKFEKEEVLLSVLHIELRSYGIGAGVTGD